MIKYEYNRGWTGGLRATAGMYGIQSSERTTVRAVFIIGKLKLIAKREDSAPCAAYVIYGSVRVPPA